jgi:hypothetical protein
MHQLAQTAFEFKADAPPLLDIFRERSWARALLVREHQLDLREAVDTLQAAAVSYGMVAAYGQDWVQRQMAVAFDRWRHLSC